MKLRLLLAELVEVANATLHVVHGLRALVRVGKPVLESPFPWLSVSTDGHQTKHILK